jgi:hypothetical protein
VDPGDNADEEVKSDAVAFLESRCDRLGADACHPHMALGIVFELIVHIVGELAVNADRLQLVKHGFA